MSPTRYYKGVSTWYHLRHNLVSFKIILMLGSDPQNVDFIGFMVGGLTFAESSPRDSSDHPGLSTTVLYNLLSPSLIAPPTYSPSPLINLKHTDLLAVSQTYQAHSSLCAD